jgi:hypothetical protein
MVVAPLELVAPLLASVVAPLVLAVAPLATEAEAVGLALPLAEESELGSDFQSE